LRETQLLLDGARAELERVRALAPGRITVHPSVLARQIILRFHGLSFARWEDRKIFFGVPEARQELTPSTNGVLKQLLHDLTAHRHPLAADTVRPLFRAQPERWMETLGSGRCDACGRGVRSAIRLRTGPGQTPVATTAFSNVLTVTRSGRLAILELKGDGISESAVAGCGLLAPHSASSGSGRPGSVRLFPGIELQAAPPIVYLVAPALRFHPATDRLLRMLTPQLEIVRVGLAKTGVAASASYFGNK